MNDNALKKKCGASLVEVMMAVLILAFMATAIPTALRHPREIVVESLLQEAAALAGAEALELARGWNPDDLSSGWTAAASALGSRYGLNSKTLTITPSVSPYSGDLVLVSVSVSPAGSGGDSVYLETLIYAP